MSRREKRVWDLYCNGESLDTIWINANCKDRDESLRIVRQLSWDHFLKTGENMIDKRKGSDQ